MKYESLRGSEIIINRHCRFWDDSGVDTQEIAFAGCVALCSQLFEYHMVTEAKGMEEARRYCEEHYESLAVIRNRHDVERLAKRATASGVGFRFGHGFWIGLRLTEELTWQWSVEETDAGAGLAVYTNWANFLPDSSHHCGGMSANGSWVSDVCEATRPFVCQLGERVTPSMGGGLGCTSCKSSTARVFFSL